MLEISELVRLDHASGRVDFFIDAPEPGLRTAGYTVPVEGWVVVQDRAVTAIELRHGDELIRESPIWKPRPDVAAHLPQVPNVTSGFCTAVSALGLPPAFELRLDAVLEGGERLPLVLLRGQRSSAPLGWTPRFKPLLVTSLGRTGTTWLLRLLAEHPAIVSHRTYPYETPTAGYLLRVARTLTDPANRFDPVTPAVLNGSTDMSSRNPMFDLSLSPLKHSCPAGFREIRGWLHGDFVAGVIRFAQSQIDEFYGRLAAVQGQPEPVYFAEKFLPNDIPWMVQQFYPDHREIILVRDLRDVVCSIFAFSAKRDTARFGVDAAASEVEYVEGYFRHSALQLLDAWRRRAGSAYLLRYEDLILRPAETLTSVLGYLSLEHTPERVADVLARAEEPMAYLDEHRTTPDAASSVGRWRRDLSPALQETARRALGDVLRAFGYTDDP